MSDKIIDKNECNCGKVCSALEHANTCPVKPNHIMVAGPSDNETEVLDRFKAFGYNPISALPKELFEMMKCPKCGYWFPRWEYTRCLSCDEPH